MGGVTFRVHRASDRYPYSEKPPCEGSVLFEVTHRTTADGKPFAERTWQIEITNLDQLMQLLKEEGRLILRHQDYSNWEDGAPPSDDPPEITIYDDYVE